MADPRAVIVVGLGFGDEGKGTVTDHLVRTRGAKTVVRFNGAPQAGHNVVTPDGRWHCFAQLGAGSFVPGVRTHLAPRMLVELENLATEADVLEGKGVPAPLQRVSLDPSCTVITPMHKLLGQLTEILRGEARVGTCGMGVGQAVRGREAGEGITVASLLDGPQGLERLRDLALQRAGALAGSAPSPQVRDLLAYFLKRCRPDALHRAYLAVLSRCRLQGSGEALREALDAGPVIFEGAQGALLDRTRGFAPYVTQSRTTADDALDLCVPLLPPSEIQTLGVLRAYGHRHGPGPFPTEDPALAAHLADPHNRENRWQGPFRLGWMDLVLLRYGRSLQPSLDSLAVTGLDRLAGLASVRLCTAYTSASDGRQISALERPQLDARDTCEWQHFPGWASQAGALPRGAKVYLRAIEGGLGLGVSLLSLGPSASDKVARPF